MEYCCSIDNSVKAIALKLTHWISVREGCKDDKQVRLHRQLAADLVFFVAFFATLIAGVAPSRKNDKPCCLTWRAFRIFPMNSQVADYQTFQVRNGSLLCHVDCRGGKVP